MNGRRRVIQKGIHSSAIVKHDVRLLLEYGASSADVPHVQRTHATTKSAKAAIA